MRAHTVVSVFASLGLFGAACVASKSSLGDPTPQGDDTSTGGGSTSGASGQASVSSTSVATDDTSNVMPFDVYPGNTAGPPDDESGTGIPFDVLLGECDQADHEVCYAEILAACSDGGSWDVDEACVHAVEDCYPISFPPVVPADVVEACHAELERSCITSNAPGCGHALCECTIGEVPFDVTSSWDVLWLACTPGAQSDCQTAVDFCFPGYGLTATAYEACRADIVAAHPQCDCPSCEDNICAENLADCLGV